jgi:hypothetical protein
MSEKDIQETVEQIDEMESSSAATLKPNGKDSKTELLAKMMRVVGGMKRDDLSAFLDKTLEQVGQEDESVPDTAAKNQASIAAKGSEAPQPETAKPFASVKEDMEDIFADQEDLSEDFKTRASTLFEAAVTNRVILEKAALEEQVEQQVEEKVMAIVDDLNEKVETYVDYVAEKWMEENALAIETDYRSEVTESFIDGLKKLFEESYIEVPAEKRDLLGELQEQVASLQESLESIESENVKLNSLINEARIEAAFDDIAEGLADTQIEKLRTLAEGMSFDSIEDYREKLEIVKHQYFSESKGEQKSSTGLIDEETNVGSNDDLQEEAVVPAEMKSYFQAISKTVKK